MKKFACHYALLRFRPFVETGEFANVGCRADGAGCRLLRLPPAHPITAASPGFSISSIVGSIWRGRGLFKQEVDRFAADLRRLALGDGHATLDLPLAGQLFTEFVRPREAMLQFDDQRIALADDPQVKLDTLFDHYIERNFVTREYQERLLETMVRKLLVGRQLGAAYRAEKVGNPEFTVNFPFVHRHDGRADPHHQAFVPGPG